MRNMLDAHLAEVRVDLLKAKACIYCGVVLRGMRRKLCGGTLCRRAYNADYGRDRRGTCERITIHCRRCETKKSFRSDDVHGLLVFASQHKFSRNADCLGAEESV